MRSRALLALPLLLLAGCGASARLATAPPPTRTETVARASPCNVPHSGPLDYRWPVRPFDAQHPIRGNFGDPRTVSQERFGLDDLGDPGAYSFHNGVDISAAPGTPVYPVVSGIARRRHGDEVLVRAEGGRRRFQYWHIAPAVRDGQHVLAGLTMLGRVQRPARHVHLTEIDRGRVTNPAEHLRPYADRTVPVVRDLLFTGQEGRLLDPAALSGPASIVADAYDRPPLPVPGAWDGFPVTPALVRWSLLDRDGRALVARTVVDFRRSEPPNQDFWQVYAAGSYQNFPVFEHRYYWRRPGRYLFRLTPQPLDTRRLPNGSYTVRVAVSDVCGNRGTLEQPVRIANRPAR